MASPLETEDFYDLAEVGAVAVSPDGDRVAVTVEEFDGDADERLRSVFVVPTDGSEPPHRLTRASTASAPAWSPDGTKLGVVAERETPVDRRVGPPTEDEGDEEPSSQVWVFDLERGGDAVQVTDREEGVREFDWAPDGERIVVSARDPTEEQAEMLEDRRDGGAIEIERIQHKADGVGWLDDVDTYLFVVDVESGEERRLDDAVGAGSLEPLMGMHPAWGPGGIAFATNRTETPDESMAMHCYVVDPDETDPAAELLVGGDVRVTQPTWSPDGDRIAYVGGHPRNWYLPSEVGVVDVETGQTTSTTADLDRTVARDGAPHWLDAETLLTPVADEGRTRLVRSTLAGPERVFDGLPRDATVQQVDVGGDTAVVTVSSPTEGQDAYAFDVADLGGALESPVDLGGAEGPLTRLSAFNDDLLADAVLPEVERVEYENGDGVTVEGILYRPPAAEGPLPTIVSIHGGPMSYDAPEFRFDVTYYVGQGYAVFKPNYRGSTSYGREFSESLRGSRGPLETDDVVSGVEYLVAEGVADDDRVFVTGFSYGGITTAHVLTRTDRFAAGAAEHGIYDFYANFGTDDNHLWHEDEFGLPWEVPETYRTISSITDVDQIATPLLLTAGENDWRCPPTQAEQLYVSVKKQGVDSKLVVYQDEHHAITDPDRAIHRLESLVGWFADHDAAGSA
ncbi:MAG: prolyl oligopeptidase family serine peptidase [Halanaeroarchaeum sp.]